LIYEGEFRSAILLPEWIHFFGPRQVLQNRYRSEPPPATPTVCAVLFFSHERTPGWNSSICGGGVFMAASFIESVACPIGDLRQLVHCFPFVSSIANAIHRIRVLEWYERR
jgi:hypothetical protein